MFKFQHCLPYMLVYEGQWLPFSLSVCMAAAAAHNGEGQHVLHASCTNAWYVAVDVNVQQRQQQQQTTHPEYCLEAWNQGNMCCVATYSGMDLYLLRKIRSRMCKEKATMFRNCMEV